MTRSEDTLEGHLRATEEYVQTDEFFANQENFLSADPIFHQAREITKQNLRLSSMNNPIPIDQLKSVAYAGSTAAGKGYDGNKRDNVDKTVSHAYATAKIWHEKRGENEPRLTALHTSTQLADVKTPKIRVTFGYPFDMILLEGSKAMPIIREIMSTRDLPIILLKTFIKRCHIGQLNYMCLKLYHLVQKRRRHASPFQKQ